MSEFVSYLPWIGLLIGIAALFLRDTREVAPTKPYPPIFIPVFCALAAWIGSRFAPTEVRSALLFVAAGAAGAALVRLLASSLRTSKQGAVLSALGLAVFVVGLNLPGIGFQASTKFAGLILGVAAACVPSGGSRHQHPGIEMVAGLFTLGIVSAMAHTGYRDAIQSSPALLGAVAVLSCALVLAVEKGLRGKRPWLAPAVGIVGLVALCWALFGVYLAERDLAIVAASGVLGVVVTAWLLPRGSGSPASWGVPALIWLGLATFAFSTAFGLGMAVAAFTAVASVFILDRRDLLPSVSLLIGLAFYRLFRENNPDIVLAFDIGQHYAMIGFVLGVVVLLGLSDAVLARREGVGAASQIQRGVIALVSLLVVVAASIFFGPKGAIGLIVGLAVAPMVARLTASATAWSVVGAAALQCAALAVFNTVAQTTTLDRAQKTVLLLWVSGVVLVLLAAVWLIERRKVQQVESA